MLENFRVTYDQHERLTMLAWQDPKTHRSYIWMYAFPPGAPYPMLQYRVIDPRTAGPCPHCGEHHA